MGDEQWRRATEYVSAVSELSYLSQIIIMLYEDPAKDEESDQRFVSLISVLLYLLLYHYALPSLYTYE